MSENDKVDIFIGDEEGDLTIYIDGETSSSNDKDHKGDKDND